MLTPSAYAILKNGDLEAVIYILLVVTVLNTRQSHHIVLHSRYAIFDHLNT